MAATMRPATGLYGWGSFAQVEAKFAPDTFAEVEADFAGLTFAEAEAQMAAVETAVTMRPA